MNREDTTRKFHTRISEFVRNNKLSAFGFFLLSSLVIVTFPTVLSICYLYNSVSYIDRQIDEQRIQGQEDMENMLNINYMDIYSLGYKLVSNSRIHSYSIAKSRNSQEEYEIMTYLASFASEDKVYSNCFIFFPQHDRIISYKQSSPKDNYLSKNYSKYVSSINEVLDNIQDKGWVVVKAQDREENRLFYVRPITSNTGTNQQVLIFIEVDLSYLEKRMSLYLAADDYCILGTEEEYLFCLGGEDSEDAYRALFERYREEAAEEAADQEAFDSEMTVIDPNAQGLKALYFEVNESAIRMYFQVFSYAGIELAGCLLISGILVLYFSKYHSGRIKKIELALGERKTENAFPESVQGNEYDRIMGYIASYHQDYLSINAQSAKYRQACQNLYMQNVITDRIRDKSSIRKTLQLYGIDMSGDYFKLLIFYEAIGEQEEHPDSVQNDEAEIRVMEEAINTEVYLWNSDKDKMYTLQISGKYVCILNFDNCDEQNDRSIRQVIHSIRQILKGFDIYNYQYKENDGYCSLEEISDVYRKMIQAITVETRIEKTDGNIMECVAQCLDIIKCQYSDKSLSTDAIAAQLQVSRSYLSSLFKQQIGIGLLDYIHRYRINEFKKEVRKNPNIKLHEAADKTGFGNQAALIRVFKKIEGITPGQYRDELLQKAGNKADFEE